MRQVQILVERSATSAVQELARSLGACTPVAVRAADDERSLVVTQVPNAQVGDLIDGLRGVAQAPEVTLLPLGALPLRPPLDDLDEQVRDVSRLSTLELVTSSLQSIGSWRALLVFSALAGLIGAYGVIFGVSYLLVAAMLINPMAAPALVSVVGAAIGDTRMVGRGAARFGISLAVQTLAALLFGLAYGLESSTGMMEQVTNLSVWAVLVALASGAAGAQTQIKSERDSLISGTAAGFMVAAALAPPAAVLGLSVPLGRWDYAAQMTFLLALQYVAIVTGGSVALWLNGVRSADPTLARGTARASAVAVAGMGLVTAGLVVLQLTAGPGFGKADLSRRAANAAREAVDTVEGVALVELGARFTRPEARRYEDEVLLLDVVVERTGATAQTSALEAETRAAVRAGVAANLREVVPLVRVSVLPGG